MRYRAFCFDIDGTLLDSEAHLRPRVARALHLLSETDTTLIIVTAVPQRFARIKLAELSCLCDRGVFLGGAHIVDRASCFSCQIQICAETTRDLVDGLEELDPELQVLVQCGPDHHALRLPLLPEIVAQWGYPPEALLPFEQTRSAPAAKIVAWHEERDLHHAYESLQQQLAGRAKLFLSHDGHWLQATAPKADKGRGLGRLLDHLDIDPADAIAFGDEKTDLDMFRLVGTSVAMGNALADVQSGATWVTATHDEDGVALVIERLLKT